MRLQMTALAVAALLSTAAPDAAPKTYEVGPGRKYETPSDVPWESLKPGETVAIYWRPAPYADKWAVGRSGTADRPITIRGVPGPSGELPVIDGAGARTRRALDYWNESRGVIKIGGTAVPDGRTAAYIVIEGLDVRGGRAGNAYVDHAGGPGRYEANAAAIYVEQGTHITLRRNRLHDSGNGLFIGSPASGPSGDILVEQNDIFDNGNAGSAYEHNVYTEALGITFDGNHLGPLKAGAGGNNLKDRSAGVVVRYNWIEGGNRELDLVEPDNPAILASPRYRETFVYGNVVIEREDPEGNSEIAMYGGDGPDRTKYRKGTLYFYNNTVVSIRPDQTTFIDLPTNDEHLDARNNIFYVRAAGDALGILSAAGTVVLQNNWFKPGYTPSHAALAGTISGGGTSITGSSPGFADEAGQDFHLTPDAQPRNAGAALAPAAASNPVTRQYVKHRATESRPSDGPIDVGAYEVAAAGGRGGQLVR